MKKAPGQLGSGCPPWAWSPGYPRLLLGTTHRSLLYWSILVNRKTNWGNQKLLNQKLLHHLFKEHLGGVAKGLQPSSGKILTTEELPQNHVMLFLSVWLYPIYWTRGWGYYYMVAMTFKYFMVSLLNNSSPRCYNNKNTSVFCTFSVPEHSGLQFAPAFNFFTELTLRCPL